MARAQVATLTDDTLAVGTLRSRQGVMLRPEVPGRIARLGFADGQRVRRGQLMVQLDDALQQAEVAQAKAQLGIAQSTYNRNKDLVAQNFVSQRVLDESSAALQVANAQVALAQARLERMRIVAPFDGVVGIRSVNIGDYVKDGADLVSVEDTSWLSVDFRLPERYVARLKPGQKINATLDALPGRAFEGQVAAVDSQLDANGRSLLVRARIHNGGGDLRPGMFARVRTVFEVRRDAIVVPEEALVPLGERQFVFIVVDGPNGKVAKRVQAKIGMRVPGRVELLADVAAGDTVITAGQARLTRGETIPVRVIDLANPGAGPGRPASAAASAPRRTDAPA